MTQREFFNAVINAKINDEMSTFAKEAIKKLDKRNESRSQTKSKTQLENESIKAKILEVLTTDELKVASEIGVMLEISTNKASALLRQLVESGLATVQDVKIPKKGKVKGYALAVKTDGESD